MDCREKARIPAWCDRVLWKGTNLHQVNYRTADLRFSDHRPVWATFLCEISTVDEGAKSELRRTLYYQKRVDQSDVAAAPGERFSLSDEELTRVDPIMPGLPPASSDHQKWWLDHGKSVDPGSIRNHVQISESLPVFGFCAMFSNQSFR